SICYALPLIVSFVLIEEELHPSYWNNKAKQALYTAMKVQPNVHQAKNTIFFLGDGMGVPTVTAARILKGQLEGKSGEETSLVMDTFPHLALSKTYNVDQQMPDSAATATAYLCGVKANYGTLGVSASTPRNNCSATSGNEVTSVLQRAKEAGKSVGIVTTTRVQHASPAASYAHTPDRGWYSDSDLTSEAVENGCHDIAYQLVHNVEINVILGGGRQYMFPKNMQDPEYPSSKGNRNDGINLVVDWLQNKNNAKYVWNKSKLRAAVSCLGLFEPKDCRFELDRDPTMDPSLTEMMEKAIKILSKNPKGFFLFVEDNSLAEDGKHFTTAVYGNGPGYQLANGSRPDMNATISSHKDYRQQAPVPLGSETHGIEDVAIYAKGPMSHLFHGVQEQNYIAHVIAYAACLEPYNDCKLSLSSRAGSVHPSLLLLLMGLLLLSLYSV
uniref:alkaline phosphatase n=1 Tax=Mola mola TaxID=94237 RepID=A0A3Q3WFU6_MOLML